MVQEYVEHLAAYHGSRPPPLPDTPNECFACAIADMLVRLANERDDLNAVLDSTLENLTRISDKARSITMPQPSTNTEVSHD